MQKVKLQPIYTESNTTAAFQLNWSLTLSMREKLLVPASIFESLKRATESDAVRILEQKQMDDLRLQFFDEAANLKEPQFSNHGRYLHNLHIVIENRDHLHNVHEDVLRKLRSMIIRSCAQKQHLLARIGLVSNHMHLLLGCNNVCSPQSVALGLMNNMAYALGMKAISEFSYYVGTFGPYDRNAIRRALPSSN